MKVKVETCWNGGDNYSQRLTLPDGRRYSVRGDWTAEVKREARRILEVETGIPATSFRFDVH